MNSPHPFPRLFQKSVLFPLFISLFLLLIYPLNAVTKEKDTKPTVERHKIMKINKRYVAVDNVCAWPQLRLRENGEIFMTGFNRPHHGQAEGDVDLWVSTDQGAFFEYVGTPVVHAPTENRMNHCSGFANNGDFITIISGYSNRPKERRYWGNEYVEKIVKKSRTLVPIIARSGDGGKTVTNVPLQFENEASIIPYGEIVKVDETTLMCSVYLVGTKEAKSFFETPTSKAGVLLSYDDGYTWNVFYGIDEDLNETSLAVLDNKIIAVARSVTMRRLILYESFDRGLTWAKKETLSLRNQVPAAVTVLQDKRVLISYGCRNNQKSIMYRIGDENAENFSEPNILQVIETEGDMGYPSSVQLANGSIVTAYYTSRDSHHHRYHVGIIHWEL